MWLKGGFKGYPKAIFKSPLSCIQAHLGSNHLTFKGGGEDIAKKVPALISGKKYSGRKGQHKKFPVYLWKHFCTPKTVFALRKLLFDVRNLLFALRKLLSYSENYIIYFGNDFLHYKNQLFCSLKTVSCTSRSLAYMPRATIHVGVKFLHPPCLNKNMSSGTKGRRKTFVCSKNRDK